tara:strand:+ start:3094 stop:4077 length:984 start_codon:yes stop_codon:yes gene_type:complete
MKNKNSKIQDYKTFEEIKTKSFKNLHNWSAETPEHHGVELEATNILVNKIKDTPSLNWLNERGYNIVVVDGEKRGGTLDNIGQTGVPYTFFLIPSWNKEDYIDHIEDDWGAIEEEVLNAFNILGMDIDNLDIYGSSKGSEYEIKLDGKEVEIWDVLKYYEENKERWDDVKKEISIVDGSDDDFRGSRYNDDYPFWGARVPLRFNRVPDKETKQYRIICEYGLTMLKWEISKYLKASGKDRYNDLCRHNPFDSDVIYRDDDAVVTYMNLSNVNITRNEDLKMACKAGDNMYQGGKLFEQNHQEARFKVSPEFVVRFMKESGNMDISKI